MSTVFDLASPPAPKAPRIRRGGWSWGPVEGAKLRVLSLGAGVQSTTLGCVNWLTAHRYPVPDNSACWYCPYVDDIEWARIQREEPDVFVMACELDDGLRGVPGKPDEFVHRSRRPLREVDFSTAEDRGQGMLMVCEAGCGL